MQLPAKGKSRMQLVHPAPQREISDRGRPWPVINAAPADVQHLGLLGDRQIMGAVDLIFPRADGSPAVCVDSGSEEDTAAQEVEAGASIHLALDQLELVDLPLCLSAAPRHGERRSDRRFILLQAGREGLDDRNTAGPGLLKPGPENGERVGRRFVAVDTAASHQPGEAADQGEDDAKLRVLSNPGEHRGRRRIESFRA